MTDRLPAHVREIVEEIETEIGESRIDAVEALEGDRVVPIEGSADVAAPNGRIEAAVREILREIGEDPDREGLRGTPERVHRMYSELTAGYHVRPGAPHQRGDLRRRLLRDGRRPVMCPFYSLCEHHLLPFFGTAAVAYIPDGKVLGLSKIPRVVETFARRLQVQERMTQQIADFLMEHLQPKGVGVVIEATHLCAVDARRPQARAPS